MGHRSAHVFALRETHVRDAVGFYRLLLLLLLPTSVLSPAGAASFLVTSSSAMPGLVSVVLRTAEKRGPNVVHTSTEQIYIMDTIEVDRLGEKAHAWTDRGLTESLAAKTPKVCHMYIPASQTGTRTCLPACLCLVGHVFHLCDYSNSNTQSLERQQYWKELPTPPETGNN